MVLTICIGKGTVGNNIYIFRANIHAGYSDTWDAGRTLRTGERRVNSYLIVYQKCLVAKLKTEDHGVRTLLPRACVSGF